MSSSSVNFPTNCYITEKDVNFILKSFLNTSEFIIEKYSIGNDNAKMLGFLSDYWKLQVDVGPNFKKLFFFIKAVSRLNLAKAEMVKEAKMFERELCYYNTIMKLIELPDIKPWCPRLVAVLNDAMVFEDINARSYKLRCKFERFDLNHTLQALDALARFHISSVIYEENKSKVLQRNYRLHEEFKQYLDEAGYRETCPWFAQCMNGAIKSIKTFSKYETEEIELIESKWSNVWSTALSLSSYSSKYRNVICHRDLWNNNILFKYNEANEPNDCVFVDFQSIRYQPPAGDVMILLCCNLEPKFRENNLEFFLNFYYEKLKQLSLEHEIEIDNIINRRDFLISCNEQRLWGLVVCACLLPQFWINEKLTVEMFGEAEQFDKILSKNKAAFILDMMKDNQDYKETVLEIFEEIAERYCLSVCVDGYSE